MRPDRSAAPVSRRAFLRRASVIGAATAVGASATSAHGAGSVQRVSDDWMGVLVDLSLCVGCRKCEWACRKANELAHDEPIDAYEDDSVFEDRRRPSADQLTVVNRHTPAATDGAPVHVKTQCMHCFEPACASACLVGAFTKTPEGPVVYDSSACIGCRYCMVACPFGMPAYTYDNPTSPVVRKCSMCFERIAKEGGRPACVDTCPVEALTFGKRSDLLALARSKIKSEPEKYVDHVYGEHEAGGTGWLYLSPAPFEQIGFNTNIGNTPYPALTKGFLSIVPLIVTLWPALLMGAYAFTKHRERQSAAHVAAAAVTTTGGEARDV
ncbi:MAG: 4Fe-4S dicluster domain-containing protein [Planctomycetes bacterium]|nr:4Fe-4S dicluster domain-containing protein [Planctomycetota bacterium]